MGNKSLLVFARTLSGRFSNKEQVQKNPRLFAHINIYFLPLPWSIFRGPGFYSEQSYDYSPWSPYRQSIHRLVELDQLIIMENYRLKNEQRIAGAGLYPSLLKNIKLNKSEFRAGCSMHFREISPGHYQGEVEPGRLCIIPWQGEKTYLTSKVEFDKYNWESLDQGFNIKTNQHVWGSENGPLYFKRIYTYDDTLTKNLSRHD